MITKEEKAAWQKNYRAANKDKIAAKRKAFKEANQEKLDAYHRAYYKKNVDIIAEKQKIYYAANYKKIAAKRNSYWVKNKAVIKEVRAKRKKRISLFTLSLKLAKCGKLKRSDIRWRSILRHALIHTKRLFIKL